MGTRKGCLLGLLPLTGMSYWENPLVRLHLSAGPGALWESHKLENVPDKNDVCAAQFALWASHPELYRWMVAWIDCPLLSDSFSVYFRLGKHII